MAGIFHIEKTLWALSVAIRAALLLLLLGRRHYRNYPAFTVYIVADLFQTAALYITYRRWDFNSLVAWRVGWATQTVVLCVRAFAVVEVCRHALGRYIGIWALAQRLLVICALAVLTYSLLTAQHQWRYALNSAELSLELAIASAIVALLLFARYYHLLPESRVRLVAFGLCLYSVFVAINDTILERWLYRFVATWNLLDTLAFMASSLIWIWAFRDPASQAAGGPPNRDSSLYRRLSPQINERLRALNDSLDKFRQAGVHHP
jgi:hypothetical protein